MQDGDILKVFPVVKNNEKVVYLDGNVRRPGKYQLHPDMRISDLVTSYEILLPESYFTYAVVERFDPPSYLARIIPFNLSNVFENPQGEDNLALQSKDRVIIYHRDYFEPDRSISINGSITTPGKYKLLENMKIRDLILQAGGLREDASAIRGELYRRKYTGESVETEKIDFEVTPAMENDPQHNIVLQKFDRVFIRNKLGWQDERVVELQGEFVYPGTYILFEGETLDQLIKRAGGFTDEAYVDAAIFTRESVKEMERKRNEEYMRTLESDIARLTAEMAAKEKSAEAAQILQQQTAMLDRLKNIEPVGRIVIDLNNPEKRIAFLMDNGDRIVVPKKLNTVSVIGEVFNPATFQYDTRNPQVRQYINRSGGMKSNADKRNMYVICANGSVVSRKMENIRRYDMKPGDVVVVPQRIKFTNAYKVFIDTVDAISKVAMTAAVVISLIETTKQ